MSLESGVWGSESFWKAIRGEKISLEAWPDVLLRAKREGVLTYLASLHPEIPGRGEILKAAAAEHLAGLEALRVAKQVLEGVARPWALLKGLGLAYSCYDNPADRSIGDIDILVAPEDIPRFETALLENGFIRPAGHREIFLGPNRNFDRLDLHTTLINDYRVPARGLVEGRREDWRMSLEEIEMPFGSIPVLAPRLAARHLVLHFIHHHGLAGAKWLLDIHLFRRKHPFAFDEMRNWSRSSEVLGNLLDTLLGGGARSPSPPRGLSGLAETSCITGESAYALRFLLSLRDIPDAAGRAGFVWQAVLPTGEDVSEIYGGERKGRLRHLRRLGGAAVSLARLVARRGKGRTS